jgi:hypothetical protein
MMIRASAGRGKKDLREECHNMYMASSSLDERQLLSNLYIVLINGGTITIDHEKEPKFIYEIPTGGNNEESN